MASGRRCPDCGSTELVEDSHYSQSQLVCSDCGCVVTEGVLTTTFSDEGNLRGTCGSLSRDVGTVWGGKMIDVGSSYLPPTPCHVNELFAGGQGLPCLCASGTISGMDK